MTQRNPHFMNGVPELVILKLLQKREMYGYELVQAIKDESGGTLTFGEGCIYPLLHKLEERGDLTARRLDVGGRSRVVYRVTPQGTKQFAESTAAWKRVAASVNNILYGGTHERAKSA